MPTILTAANSAYFKMLEATIFYVHKFFPQAKLIVYNLGLTNDQFQKVSNFTRAGQPVYMSTDSMN